jgi:hypothetical protein
MNLSAKQLQLQRQTDVVFEAVCSSLLNGKRLSIVEAPPGSGKTHLLLRIIHELVSKGWRVALATQTNNQATDVAARFATEHPSSPVARFSRSGSTPPQDFPIRAKWVTKFSDLSSGPGLHVATAAKWATLKDPVPYALLAIDEAWQMDWAKLMQCSDMSEKFLMIGDPGQIEPVTSVDTSRWGTSLRPPHIAAPEVVKSDPNLLDQASLHFLPACRRLPKNAVEFVKPFYDFDFDSYAEHQDRVFTSTKGSRIVDLLHDFAPILATIPTPLDGPPQSTDTELALAIKSIIKGLMESGVLFSTDPEKATDFLRQEHIGVVASHRAMNGLIRKTLGSDFPDVKIDTPERWQGLETPFMIAVHPLSGVTDPSEFDLSTGRLCVMVSRQQVGLIIVARDHVGKTIENVIPSATQPPDAKDRIGRGRRAHLEFWNQLVGGRRIIKL